MIFKCKMCGGSLEVSEGMTVCECEYCGTKQTLPAFDNEKKINLFNRANRLRFKCEFDSADGIYQNIVSEFPNEAEAYWGLCLCKYGIEYVEDPATGNKVPTCHRTTYESILNDSDYLSALKNADGVARYVYQSEAKAIDSLQQKILSVVKDEKPYDVFICYKETDADKQRTPDSVMAQDIYDNLTDKGLKVFFSRITLEDKLGVDYEPYIFAALNSAKVMLVVATCLDHIEAVWVKNEWSRFAKLAATDKNKALIPCYSGFDPADLPTALASRQAQDMDKLGAMQDLVRGVCKITGINTSFHNETESTEQRSDSEITKLLKRIPLYLEDQKWRQASDCCDRILDIEPENEIVFLYRLLIDCQKRNISELADSDIEYTSNPNYLRIISISDEKISKEIELCNQKWQINRAKRLIQEGKNKKLLLCFEEAETVFLKYKLFDEIEKSKIIKTDVFYLPLLEEIKEYDKTLSLPDKLSDNMRKQFELYSHDDTFCIAV